MSLSDKSVQKFKEIFEKEYGKKLSDVEVREQGERLVKFFEILIKMKRRGLKPAEPHDKPDAGPLEPAATDGPSGTFPETTDGANA